MFSKLKSLFNNNAARVFAVCNIAGATCVSMSGVATDNFLRMGAGKLGIIGNLLLLSNNPNFRKLSLITLVLGGAAYVGSGFTEGTLSELFIGASVVGAFGSKLAKRDSLSTRFFYGAVAGVLGAGLEPTFHGKSVEPNMLSAVAFYLIACAAIRQVNQNDLRMNKSNFSLS